MKNCHQIHPMGEEISETRTGISPIPLDLNGQDGTPLLRDCFRETVPDSGLPDICFQCGACASGCPASGVFGMDPRKFVRMVSMGLDNELLNNKWVWVCTLCNRCVLTCPMNIHIPKLVFLVRTHWDNADKPAPLVDLCRHCLETDTGSSLNMNRFDWRFIIEDTADEARNNQEGFESLAVPVDKKNTELFLTQSSHIPLTEPEEMSPLWKILHLAGADWTYGAAAWAADNACMYLGDIKAWERVVRLRARAVEELGCKVLVNTECGHDHWAIKQGLERFNIAHNFKVKSIIEYYAKWIRQGRLRVNSDWNRNLKVRFTVQDPCQMTRDGKDIAQALRFVVKQAVGEENFIDMSPGGANNYCCGGGGGGLDSGFIEGRRYYGKIKLNQILKTDATYCITPCNSCFRQIHDLSRHHGAGFYTVHLWTILCLALGILGAGERKYLGQDLAGVGLP
jgi:Fe-S oxidoreductase